jgi:hypothetical protein
MGDSAMNASVRSDAPALGAAQSDVAAGLAAGPSGAQAFEHDLANAQESVAAGMTDIIPAHQNYREEVEQRERQDIGDHNRRVRDIQEDQQAAMQTVEHDRLAGSAKKLKDWAAEQID